MVQGPGAVMCTVPGDGMVTLHWPLGVKPRASGSRGGADPEVRIAKRLVRPKREVDRLVRLNVR
jgi:hypothetical protein